MLGDGNWSGYRGGKNSAIKGDSKPLEQMCLDWTWPV